ncbi:FG-GAP-like repeat-containing protein [Nonomuraea sp. NPDC050478]|uniref:FG-GAP-like repeat-containing protein n=1 Tax=Nonomuraea sp. NPDC050478 TaxID=3364365 RepID=UPI0037B7337C
MNVLLSACLILPLVTGTGAALPACSGAPSDFDGDGRPDLAVAAPYDDRRSGSVTILYGSGREQRLAQDEPEPGDAFGASLAVGHFDGDRCADLAVGVPDEFLGDRVPGADGNGVVRLYHGSPGGLRPGEELSLHEPSSDRFGASLAAGDFDGDGRDELAAGAPGRGRGGGVTVYWMKGRDPYPITQRTGWVRQAARSTDGWGETLAAGDFDGDGRDELVVGAPADTVTKDGQGSVTVLDPHRRRALRLTQSSPGVAGSAEKWDAFGAALATGDFDGDGRDDLAIGVPGEGLTAGQRAMDYGDGALHVVYGTRNGLRGARSEMWTQRLLKGEPRYYDRFGASLAAGDLDGDGDDELAVGVPGEDSVQVMPGSPRGGLSRYGDVRIKEKGSTVSVLPAPGGGPATLVVAAPGRGVVTSLPGRRGEGAAPRFGRAREMGSGEGLYGYALGAR